MRQKELRIALVCYGGISLAVYMHGVTKEVWKLARASRAFIAGEAAGSGVEGVYRAMLDHIQSKHRLRLRVLPDIIAGASAGGINGVFLAQAVYTGQSLEPLTQMWLERADVDVLLDPDARVFSRFFKFWAVPVVGLLLRQPGNMISSTVAPETRAEVRNKLSRLVRSRWFQPPFGGIGFSRVLSDALDAMAISAPGKPLLPKEHPLDLFVTATDFHGFQQQIQLHSPPVVEESEHRLTIGFRGITGTQGGTDLAAHPELVLAARATASFPGAFPALRLSEIDAMVAERGQTWPGRAAFIARILPSHVKDGTIDDVALIDGSVLVNAPFAEAMRVLTDRPAQREVDRRFVYIDPKPRAPIRKKDSARHYQQAPGFFSVIFGSLSSIPRTQPIRDNLDMLARQSHEMERMQAIIEAMRPEVEQAVTSLFGRTLFLDRPSPKRLIAWRNKAHNAAASQAGYAYQAYARVKLAGIVDSLAALIWQATPQLKLVSPEPISQVITALLAHNGVAGITTHKRESITPELATFFRAHDLSYRIRRLRLLVRRLNDDWDDLGNISEAAREAARDALYRILALYFERETSATLGDDFAELAAQVIRHPGIVLETIADRRGLAEVDILADALLAEALAAMPQALRRMMLLSYLSFSYYDAATLPLLRGEGVNEYEPVKVDRIAPEDACSIRDGGGAATLRGDEFHNFGAFFSRSYRENDYLWGRLHGAERMIDLIASTLSETMPIAVAELAKFKRAAFLAVLDEEHDRLNADPTLVPGIRAEVIANLAHP